jgi:tetratricopeptide (TPR) repeat protein
VFISLDGYWPLDYTYVRYYWYGWHPFVWYGYYPIPYEVGSNQYNYYTYNYYYDGDQVTSSQQYQPSQAPVEDYTKPVDQNTFADVREKLAKQAAAPPAAPTEADKLFDEAVKAFESAEYATAVEQLARAVMLTPEDVILPFAYSQALFANAQYSEAAEVLRKALGKVTPDKQGVFYPRGLYANDDLLFEHIQRLFDRVEQYNYDADLQLLLGYHLLGIGETDSAIEPLEQASQDMTNAEAAKVLLEMAQKIKAAEAAGNATQDSEDIQAPSDNPDGD